MDETIRKIQAVFITAIVLFCIFMMFYVLRKGPATDNTVIVNELNEIDNTVVENQTNENVENAVNIENTINEENVVENKIDESSNKTEEENTVEIPEESLQSKEERAIELVKQDWGITDGVYFTKVAINSKGNYIISVNDSSSSKTLAFYEVDLNNGTIKRK